MPPRLRVLIVDDSEDDAVLIARRLQRDGYAVDWTRVDEPAAMAEALASTPWDIIISDVSMPSFTAADALSMYQRHGSDCPFVVVSGTVGEEAAVSLLKAGAHDFVLKDNLARLVPALEREFVDSETRRAKRETEAQLRQANAELESALAAKTRFLAAASHDLRQPVQALFCFTAVLHSQLQGMAALNTVRELSGALDGLKLLLDSLLDVSKLDAGIINAEVRRFHLGEVMEELAAQMGPVARAKGLELRMVRSGAVVESDPTLLGRILRNLIENAIRYTPSGRILVGARRRGASVVVQVCDTGIGIHEDLRDKIFEEFFQVGNAERDRRKGLGLGLAIVQRLSRLLGHAMEVRSSPDRGSTFQVTVPLAAAVEPASSHPPAQESMDLALGDGSILIIDDEAVVARATAALIDAMGYHACAVESAEQALEKLRQGCRPAAIIADYRLREGKTGLDAIGLICAHCSKRIPSLLLTGDTAPDRLREAEAAGVPTLHKPVRPDELVRALVQLVDETPEYPHRA